MDFEARAVVGARRGNRFEIPPQGTIDLFHAYHCAEDVGADVWDFALEIADLQDSGLSMTDLRWMVAKGLVEHRRDVSADSDTHRSFERISGFRFTSESAFALTGLGAQFASHYLEGEDNGWSASGQEVEPTPALRSRKLTESCANLDVLHNDANLESVAAKPSWDSCRRELKVGSQLVKRFRVPARNQQWILDVFHEDEWPDQIDDPLPRSPNIDPKTRLHDTINRLNGNQSNQLIRFHGNGTGMAIFWELISA